MTYAKFNPSLNKSIDGMLGSFLNDLPNVLTKSYTTESNGQAPVNIFEGKDHYKIEFAVPGRNKADFSIQMDQNLLSVSYDKKVQPSNENEKIVRSEFNFSSFKRTFTLDDKVESEKISAKYENGILILNIPKKEQQIISPKKIEIL